MVRTTTAVKQVMGPVEWALLMVLALLWGGSFFFSKIAVGELPPLTVVLCRVVLAALALNLVVLLSGRRMPADPRLWGAFFIMGVLNNVIPFSLIFWGQTQIASGLAAILNATTPLFTVLVAHVATKDEKLSTSRLFGVFAGMMGVAVMIGPGAFAGGGASTLAKIGGPRRGAVVRVRRDLGPAVPWTATDDRREWAIVRVGDRDDAGCAPDRPVLVARLP